MNVYHEARGEPLDGKIGVALVVMHRVADKQHPNTVCGVIADGASRRTGCQFSWVCENRPKRPRERDQWLISQAVASAVLREEVPDVVRGARYFARCEVQKSWMRSLRLVTRIGDHCWYGDAVDNDQDEPVTYGFAIVSSVQKPSKPSDLKLVAVPIQPDTELPSPAGSLQPVDLVSSSVAGDSLEQFETLKDWVAKDTRWRSDQVNQSGLFATRLSAQPEAWMTLQ